MLRALAAAVVMAVMTVMAVVVGCARDGVKESDTDNAKDGAAIVAALQQWPIDFNAERLDAVCGLFADDVVLIYPDSPDRNRQQFCDQMSGKFADPAKTFEYAPPEINEVLVDGDLATVRLVWTLTVRDATGKVLETVREDGVDVFRRQADGTWKIHVSHAFTRE